MSAAKSSMAIWALLLPALALGGQSQAHSLADAVKIQDRAAVRTLLSQKARDVNSPQGDGSTALHWAVQWNDAETVAALIRAGAKIDAVTDQGVTPLSLAALNASPVMVDTLLKAGADAKAATGLGETVLMTAARTGNLDVVRQLVERGADVNATSSSGQTALMWAAAEGHAPVAKYLLDKGAAVWARSNGGFTPILFAAQQGRIEAGRVLLAAGADVNDMGPEGIGGNTNSRPFQPNARISALMMAIDSRQEDMAKFLLDRGANPNVKAQGRTALHSAVQYAMPGLVRALIAKGADVNARLDRTLPAIAFLIQLQNGLENSYVGATPFFMAASYGDVESMRMLVAAGADPKLKTNDNTTALMVASGVDFIEGQDKYGHHWFQTTTVPLQQRQLAAMAYCLEVGIDINAVNDKGQTALHGATYYGGTLLVPFLVEKGANINVINKRGQTPWLIASKGEYRSGSYYTFPETAALLERLGADTKIGEDLGRNVAAAAGNPQAAAGAGGGGRRGALAANAGAGAGAGAAANAAAGAAATPPTSPEAAR